MRLPLIVMKFLFNNLLSFINSISNCSITINIKHLSRNHYGENLHLVAHEPTIPTKCCSIANNHVLKRSRNCRTYISLVTQLSRDKTHICPFVVKFTAYWTYLKSDKYTNTMYFILSFSVCYESLRILFCSGRWKAGQVLYSKFKLINALKIL